LLQTLPRDDGGDADRRISKGEGLVLAKSHISQLEGEKRVLEEERQELEGNVEELKRRLVGIVGVCVP
jgi:predicted nuclease with TOPRIM domain